MKSRVIRVMAVLLMLSACAQHGPGQRPGSAHDQVNQRHDAKRQESNMPKASHQEAGYHQDRPGHHRHHSPAATPAEQYAATVAMLISAQIFACTFVVVILDGHCDFHVGTGYYY